jgi:hypothetical protein
VRLHVSRTQHDSSASTRASLAWLVISSAWGAAAIVAVGLDASSAYRAPIVLPFVLVCPGLALVRLLGIPTATARLSLGVALSLVLAVLVPAALLYAGAWSPAAALAILIAVAVAAATIELVTTALSIRLRTR